MASQGEETPAQRIKVLNFTSEHGKEAVSQKAKVILASSDGEETPPARSKVYTDCTDELPTLLTRRHRRALTASTAEDRKKGMNLEGVTLEERWVTEEATELQKQLKEEGLSQTSFFLGVMNLLVIAFVFGKWPQHVWLLYTLECAILIPAWYSHVIHYRNGKWFAVELCWVMNTLFTIYMLATLLGVMPEGLKMFCFQAFYTHSSYLSAFVVVGNQSVVFHSVEKTASLFIHLTPVLVAVTIRWSSWLKCEMQEHWPGYFPTDEELNQVSTLQNFSAGFSMYMIWWVAYMIWFLTMGIDLPARGFPTVFGNIYERSKLEPLFKRRFGVTGLRAHGCIFMVIHLLLCLVGIFCAASIGWWIMCFAFAWCSLHLVFAIWSGAGYHLHVVVRHFDGGKVTRERSLKGSQAHELRAGEHK